MDHELYRIYLMMFHEGKKKAKIKQEDNILYFYNPYGYKGIAKKYRIIDHIVYICEINLNEKRP